MNEDLISRRKALSLLDHAKKAAERGYKGDRLKGVLAGINICVGLIGEMECEGEENG